MLSIKRNTKESKKKNGRTIAPPKAISRLYNLDNELTKNSSKELNPKEPNGHDQASNSDFLHN